MKRLDWALLSWLTVLTMTANLQSVKRERPLIGVRLSSALLEALDRFIGEQKFPVNRQAVIRLALRRYLKLDDEPLSVDH